MKRIQEKFTGALSALKDKLGSIHADPQKVSMGYAFGVFLASTPFIGIKVFIAMFFTMIFKWSKVSALIGVFHVNLFTGPFFYGCSFLVGQKVLGTRTDFTLNGNLSLASLPELLRGNISIFYCLLVGGLVLGIPMAAGAYYLAKFITCRHRKDLVIS